MRNLIPLLLLPAIMVAEPSPAQVPDVSQRPEAAPSPWWRAFGDPLIDQAVTRALDAGLDVEIASARLDQAAASARATRASLLPAIGAGASAAAIRQSLEDPQIRPFAGFPGFQRDVERYDVRATASWEIDLFGAAPKRRAARASVQAAQSDVAAARVAVAADTAAACLNIRELQQRITIAKARAASLERQRQAIRLRVDAGVVAPLELDRLTGATEGAQATIPVLEALFAGEVARLGVLIGDAATARSLSALPSPERPILPTGPALGGLEVTLSGRPDVLAAERRLAVADAGISIARAQRWPKLSLAGLIATVATAPAALFTGTATAAQGQGGLGMTLFDFGRVDAAIAQAKGQRREALATYRLSVLRAGAEVETATATLARRTAEADRQAAAAAALTRAEATARLTYDAGALDLTSLLDAERGSLAARENVVVARSAASRAIVDLFRSTAS